MKKEKLQNVALTKKQIKELEDLKLYEREMLREVIQRLIDKRKEAIKRGEE